ncbi:hypothetical protein CHU_2062 [Cytophaga hutchinsonii ATCC 33406]|uniref:Uncharacterized protein n=1 Tax=Cytophaga hutchinsonii (strain ATCC 33406 / DSM 1761 / CIP 103989 / NBRC 15051 / NCIMB 9469 / D465) TaxID=269798 RepID=A0A6N4SSA8_CYTH3|nr:hypothetical protein CHU_2062 [Cytophaga hutchinsonii ATCC 33406]
MLFIVIFLSACDRDFLFPKSNRSGTIVKKRNDSVLQIIVLFCFKRLRAASGLPWAVRKLIRYTEVVESSLPDHSSELPIPTYLSIRSEFSAIKD